MVSPITSNWSPSTEGGRKFTCGFCGTVTSPNQTWEAKGEYGPSMLLSCQYCGRPNLFDLSGQHPKHPPGRRVAGLPKDVDALEEARRAAGVGSNSCAVLACRKLLMHLAVDKEADAGKPFAFYVDYLAEKGWVPPNGRAWVKKIKDGGNEENHEIKISDDEAAEDMLFFVQTLLTFMYEVPARLDKSD